MEDLGAIVEAVREVKGSKSSLLEGEKEAEKVAEEGEEVMEEVILAAVAERVRGEPKRLAVRRTHYSRLGT